MAPLTRAHGWTPEEVDVFLVDVRNNIKDRNVHAYWTMTQVREVAYSGSSRPRFSGCGLSRSGSIFSSRTS
ncbi:hypothetical protein CSHISOI_01423 [Colletotrichum shisoi]|uniref:Uncharacterized protein n=1 Tax=Colletotrichum shisoi TaxID=2078593 RepID=A0A5Q4C4T7_9PEZI|nr:hypothetical protein CSHISOI_01423 [Colletotrichum shisoi]